MGEWTDYENEQNALRPNPDTKLIPHLGGRVHEVNFEDRNRMPGFEWRRPVVYDSTEDQLYVGQPNGNHTSMMEAMGKPSPWIAGIPHPTMVPGYINTTSDDHDRGLHFWSSANIPNVDAVHDWVEQKFGVRASDAKPFSDEEWKTATQRLAWNSPESIQRRDEQEKRWEEARVEARRGDLEEKRDWEENPEPIKWTPDPSGPDGKAFLDASGQLHTWADRGSKSDYWMHGNQAYMRGIMSDPDTHIYIQSDGTVKDKYNKGQDAPEKAKLMMQQAPWMIWPEATQTEEPHVEDDLWEDHLAADQGRLFNRHHYNDPNPQSELQRANQDKLDRLREEAEAMEQEEQEQRERHEMEREERHHPRNQDPERYEWESNPEPIFWTPGDGSRGKGFLDTDGQFHTWEEDDNSGYWMHASQARMRGVVNNYNSHIYIDSDGTVDDRYDIKHRFPDLAQSMSRQAPWLEWPGEPQQQETLEDEDWDHEASYHPRQDDEWVAGDEADFSATMPEPRWRT